MTAQTRTVLKTYFETNDKPNQSQFIDTIDSFVNLSDTAAQSITSDVSAQKKLDVNGVFTAKTSAQFLGDITVSGAVSANSINLTASVSAATVSTTGTMTAGGQITGATVSTTGAITAGGQITGASLKPTSTTGIVGTTTNDNAAAGSVGEYISSTVAIGSAVSLVNATSKTITSISLTAGDWDVHGNIGFIAAGGTTIGAIAAAISATDNTLPTAPNGGSYNTIVATLAAGITTNVIPTGMTRISLASTTTYYLVANSSFSVSTMTAFGFIGARRVR